MGKYHFIGVGGSGMSGISQVMAASGNDISGSDRNLDRGLSAGLFDTLKASGVKLVPQDGSGVTPGTDAVVVSTAIEETVPDMRRAKELGIPVIHRSEALAGLVNSRSGVAVGGTSGKSTVTGMIGFCMAFAGLDPTVINGGVVLNFAADNPPGNTRIGKSELIVVESDESDGSIIRYTPRISIVTNITLDHKPLDELKELFRTFVGNTSEAAVLNADCPHSDDIKVSGKNIITFSLHGGADIYPEKAMPGPFSGSFVLDGIIWEINMPGMHNIANALACIAVCRASGISDDVIREGLKQFKGIGRRYNIVGETGGVMVIDDFGHNPDKIRATLDTLALSGRRKLIVFQPHGFAPTKLMKDGLVEVFTTRLSKDDVLFMPEIYYAGGTASRTISSADIVDLLKDGGRNAVFIEKRQDIVAAISQEAKPGDVVTVMGARDDTLTAFCREILNALE